MELPEWVDAVTQDIFTQVQRICTQIDDGVLVNENKLWRVGERISQVALQLRTEMTSGIAQTRMSSLVHVLCTLQSAQLLVAFCADLELFQTLVSAYTLRHAFAGWTRRIFLDMHTVGCKVEYTADQLELQDIEDERRDARDLLQRVQAAVHALQTKQGLRTKEELAEVEALITQSAIIQREVRGDEAPLSLENKGVVVVRSEHVEFDKENELTRRDYRGNEVFATRWKGHPVALRMLAIDQGFPSLRIDHVVWDTKLFHTLQCWHPNLFVNYGIMHNADDPCFGVLGERPSGTTLCDLLHKRHTKLDHHRMIQFAKQIAHGMAYLHQQAPQPIVHGALSSKVVYLERREGGAHDWLRIADYGLQDVKQAGAENEFRAKRQQLASYADPELAARLAGGDESVHAVAGSASGGGDKEGGDKEGESKPYQHWPLWTAPEVLMGGRRDTKSDVYAFGMLLYELCRTKLPFRHEAESETELITRILRDKVRPRLPNETPLKLVQLMAACWHQYPSVRPSFTEIVRRISEVEVDLRTGTMKLYYDELDAETQLEDERGWRDEEWEEDREVMVAAERAREAARRAEEWEPWWKDSMPKQWDSDASSESSESEASTESEFEMEPMPDAAVRKTLQNPRDVLIGHNPYTWQRTVRAHATAVGAMWVSDAHIFTGGEDGIVKAWDRFSFEPVETLKGHTDGVTALLESADVLYSGSRDETVRVWEWRMARCKRVIRGLTGGVRCIVLAWSTLYFASQEIRALSLKHNKWKKSMRAHTKPVTSLVRAGNVLYSGSYDKTIRAWSVKTHKQVRLLEGHTAGVLSLALTQEYLISGGMDMTVRVWDVDKMQLRATLKGHTNWVTNVAVNKQHVYDIYSADKAGVVRVWNSKSLDEQQALSVHRAGIRTMVSKGNDLYSGGDDTRVIVWTCTLLGNTNYGEEVSALPVPKRERKKRRKKKKKKQAEWQKAEAHNEGTLDARAAAADEAALWDDWFVS